ALDRALSETAALAERQEGVAEALRSGEAGAATRSQQASIEEGTDAVGRQVREAAGKHALVSPQLEGALGFAKRQMAAAQAQLEEADVSPGEAAGLAGRAGDGLTATAPGSGPSPSSSSASRRRGRAPRLRRSPRKPASWRASSRPDASISRPSGASSSCTAGCWTRAGPCRARSPTRSRSE